jgi:hypothetical protein
MSLSADRSSCYLPSLLLQVPGQLRLGHIVLHFLELHFPDCTTWTVRSNAVD